MSERDQLTERRQAYILLRVQLAPGRRLRQSDLASKFNKTVLRALDLGHVAPPGEMSAASLSRRLDQTTITTRRQRSGTGGGRPRSMRTAPDQAGTCRVSSSSVNSPVTSSPSRR